MSKKYLIIALSLVLVASVLYSIQSQKKEVEKPTASNFNPYQIKDMKASSSTYLVINQTKMTINQSTFNRYMYTDTSNTQYPAGMPIILEQNKLSTIRVQNDTDVTTNVHWHGLAVDNDQDGPGILINPSSNHLYQYTPTQTGTYWYHSHERPVRDQVDGGMYGPLIIKEPSDSLYDKDYIMVLDDWTTTNNSRMQMEQVGDTDTVNGLTGNKIQPIELSTGEIVKLRFINASTAIHHELTFPTTVTITHTDGRALVAPIQTTTLRLAPGERYDVELTVTNALTSNSMITSSRNAGLTIPIHYQYLPKNELKSSPFIPATPTNIAELAPKEPNIIMNLSDQMGSKMMSHDWTINGEVFPNLDAFELNRNQLYTIRFNNQGMHQMEHPMHIHGAHFLVLSIDGVPLENEVWKDTIDIPYGKYVDVAISFDKPGEWMVHCHILDHEDGGMMTSIIVK